MTVAKSVTLSAVEMAELMATLLAVWLVLMSDKLWVASLALLTVFQAVDVRVH